LRSVARDGCYDSARRYFSDSIIVNVCDEQISEYIHGEATQTIEVERGRGCRAAVAGKTIGAVARDSGDYAIAIYFPHARVTGISDIQISRSVDRDSTGRSGQICGCRRAAVTGIVGTASCDCIDDASLPARTVTEHRATKY
jgi:hypothetical protein